MVLLLEIHMKDGHYDPQFMHVWQSTAAGNTRTEQLARGAIAHVDERIQVAGPLR